MKKFKKALSLLLAFVMVLSLLPTSALALVNSGKELYASDLNNPGLAASVDRNSPDMDTPGTVISSADGSIVVTENKNAASVGTDSLASFNAFEDDDVVCAIVVLEEESLLDQGYSTDEIADGSGEVAVQFSRLRNRHDAVVEEINRIVNGMGGAATYGLGNKIRAKYTYSVVTNAVAVEIPFAALAAVRKINGVSSAYVAPTYSLPETPYSLNAASPSMISTNTLSGAENVWNLGGVGQGYTGLGMRIAVIDTGLDVDHPSFRDEPVQVDTSLTVEELETVLLSLNASKVYDDLTIADVYYSAKVPFGFNYVDVSTDITHDNDEQGDHGTHVAGIATANKMDSTQVAGVAPDAQLLVMKVFGDTGGGQWEDILAALEDCFLLNVDAVNLSLGSPAGFTYDGDEHTAAVYKSIEDSDMIASIAAGNNYSAAAGNYWYEHTDPAVMSNQTKDPDNGVVSSPATYIGGTVVASMENSTTLLEYMIVGNNERIPYYDSAEKPFRTYMVGTQTYVVVPNYGALEDYENIDVAGKIALVSRGEITFTDKQTNAYKKGAVACIVYNNKDGDLTGMQDAGEIPNITISKAAGERLKALATDGVGTLTVTGKNDVFPNAVAGQMSDFSSWGVTPDLRLVPDITALGGNILSCYDNGQYGIMSGTSMAAPHIAGMSALMLQYLREQDYAVLKDDSDYHVVAEALLMSTAEPVIEYADGNVPYSPRKQGAGAANIYKAIQSPAYLTVYGDKPSVSLGEDAQKLGVYTFSFELNNLTNAALTYDLSGIAMTDDFFEVTVNGKNYKLMGETSRKLGAGFTFEVYGNADFSLDYNGNRVVDKNDVQKFLDDVNAGTATDMAFDLVNDGVLNTADVQALLQKIAEIDTEVVSEVTVPAGGVTTVFVTVALTNADKAYMDQNYENGIYVDGFVYCTANGETHSLSLPFMGFYGEWSQARVFDTDSWYHEGAELPERFYSAFLTEDYGVIGGNPYASILTEFYGEDNYTMEAHPATVSPNGDGLMDNVYELYVSTMRNTKLLRFTWTDASGRVLKTEDLDYVRQSVWQAAYGGITPNAYRWWMDPLSKEPIFDFAGLRNGDKVKLTIEAWLDDGDNVMDESYSTDIYVDTQTPVMSSVDIAYGKNGSRTLVVQIAENDGLALVMLMTQAGDVLECLRPQPELENGICSFAWDISEYDTKLQLMVADYAGNSVTYDVVSTDGNPHVRPDAFYGYRLKVNYPYEGSVYRLDDYNGWHSFKTPDEMLMHTAMYATGETAVIAADYVDGYIIGVDAMNRIFTMKAGDWTRNYLRDEKGEYRMITVDLGEGIFKTDFLALDMTYDTKNQILYVLTDEAEGYEGMGGYLLTVDIKTGACTTLGVLQFNEDYDFIEYVTVQGLTLACDDDGNLYTVGYVSKSLFDSIAEEYKDYGMPSPVDYNTYRQDYHGSLFKIDVLTDEYGFVTIGTTKIGDTGFKPDYRQSMTYDHDKNQMYWLANNGAQSFFYKVDIGTTSVKLTECGDVEYDSWMSAVFKPSSQSVYNGYQNASLAALVVDNRSLTMNVGSKNTINVFPQPYYADMGELTWSVDRPDVVSVNTGVITALSEGVATVTVTSGSCSVTIVVEVKAFNSELVLYDNTSAQWLSVKVGDLANRKVLTDAFNTGVGIAAAAYFNGSVYVADGANGFYRLDAKTMTGARVGATTELVSAMAFNYFDGFMYGVSEVTPRDDAWGITETYIVQLNLSTGEMETGNRNISGAEYGDFIGEYLGGLAIDDEGYFYAVYRGVENTKDYRLVKMFDTGRRGMFVEWAYALDSELCKFMTNYTTMVCADNGIYMSDCFGKLTWIDLENLPAEGEELSMAYFGTVGGTENMAMFTVRDESDVELPEVEVEGIIIPEFYSVLVGGSVAAGIMVEPWNCYPEFTYQVDDTSIATVDAVGNITGVKQGTTTLTVTAGDMTGTATIEVKASTGDIYGFMVTDFGYDGQTFVKFSDTNPTDNCRNVKAISKYMVYAGAYYDGMLYTYAQDFTVDSSRDSYLVIFNAYTYKVMNEPVRIPYTVRDMAFDYTTGNLYAIVSSADLRGAVAQIDIETGEVTIIGDTFYTLVAMTIDASGQMYVIRATEGMEHALLKVNKETGETDYVGWIGFEVGNMYQSMHYDLDTGNTYWSSIAASGISSLRLVDLQTGQTTILGSIGKTGMQLSAMYTIPGDEAVRVPEGNVTVTDVKLPEKAAGVKGDKIQLTATVLVEYEMTPTSINLNGSREDLGLVIEWSSDDESVAKVDENGLVTCVDKGVAYITATVGEMEACCMITVTEEERVFFAYDSTYNQWLSFSADDTTDVKVVSDDAAKGLTPLQATLFVSDFTGDIIYAFDREGYFYTIDPDTFDRTLMKYKPMEEEWLLTIEEGDDELGEDDDPTKVPVNLCELIMVDPEDVTIVDFAYEYGTFYVAVVIGGLDGQMLMFMPESGVCWPLDVDTSLYRPSNLLCKDEMLIWVDDYMSSWLCRAEVLGVSVEQYGYAAAGSWGYFYGSAGMWEDPLTGTVYVLRGKGEPEFDWNTNAWIGTEETDLWIINLHDGSMTEIGDIGNDVTRQIKGVYLRELTPPEN